MEASEMEEFICCEICREVYDEAVQCPKVLKCGHSFCSYCILYNFSQKYCPKCRMPFVKDDLEHISKNYALMNLSIKYSSEVIKEKKRKKNKEIVQSMEVAPEGEKDILYLLGCYKDILMVKNEELSCYTKKINLLKGEISEVNTKVKKVLNLPRVWNTTEKNVPKRMKVENDAASFALDKIEKKLTEHIKTLHGIVDEMDYVYLNLTDQIKMEKKDFKRKLMAALESNKEIAITAKDDGITRYGLLDIQKGKLKMNCVKQKPKSSVLSLTIDQCLSAIIKRIVLQISTNGVILGDVMIRLNKSSRLGSKIFLHRCLFAKDGKLIKGSQFDFDAGRTITSYDFFPLPSDVTYEALMKENVNTLWQEGDVCIRFTTHENVTEFLFCIWGDFDDGEKWEVEEMLPIGKVEEGIEVIKIATFRLLRHEKVEIINCGYF